MWSKVWGSDTRHSSLSCPRPHRNYLLATTSRVLCASLPPCTIHVHTSSPLQAVFNEEVWKPSSDTYKSAHVSLRIMNLYDFVNSKTLFRTMR